MYSSLPEYGVRALRSIPPRSNSFCHRTSVRSISRFSVSVFEQDEAYAGSLFSSSFRSVQKPALISSPPSLLPALVYLPDLLSCIAFSLSSSPAWHRLRDPIGSTFSHSLKVGGVFSYLGAFPCVEFWRVGVLFTSRRLNYVRDLQTPLPICKNVRHLFPYPLQTVQSSLLPRPPRSHHLLLYAPLFSGALGLETSGLPTLCRIVSEFKK